MGGRIGPWAHVVSEMRRGRRGSRRRTVRRGRRPRTLGGGSAEEDTELQTAILKSLREEKLAHQERLLSQKKTSWTARSGVAKILMRFSPSPPREPSLVSAHPLRLPIRKLHSSIVVPSARNHRSPWQ